MSQQAVMEAQPQTAIQQVQQLTNRVAQLETELAAVKNAIQWVLANFNHAAKPTNGYHAPASPSPAGAEWQPPTAEELAYLQTLSEDELVPIHYMTDADVRNDLDEFEQKYGLSSEEFYERWKRGEADDIWDKTGWLILYESWLRATQREQERAEVLA